MRFTTLFFDLDDTLYPSSSGLWTATRERINAYMRERMGFPPEQTELLRGKYFVEYGTTLRGLQANYQVDMDDYLAFIYDMPLDVHLQSNPELRSIIEALPARKFIFTNADRLYADRALGILGLQDCFEDILDVHTIAPYCKPMVGSFELALQAAGSPDPHTCAMLDDQARITRVARSLGIFSILVGTEATGEAANEVADALLLNWTDLPGLLEVGI
jgi:putative hydrolase of the HAD superfamily